MEKLPNRLPSVGLIGPVLPYRGGISQYTTMLHRSLRAQTDLLTISFKRQYPKSLYPGRSDLDPTHKGHSEPEVFYILDSIDPFTWVTTSRMLIAHMPNLIIIPWWTIFFAPCFGFITRYIRWRGIQVMFLCHNVTDHESSFWKAELNRRFLSQCNHFLVHSESEETKLRALIPKARITVHPHPIFHQFPPAKKILHRRSQLELLFFGFVRPYKGLDVLLKAMNLLKEEDVFLTVVGEWWGKTLLLRELMDNGRLKDKVEIIDRYVSEDEAAEYFSRADIVILPYRSATGTGVIPLAYYYGKPVIATKVGGFPDLVDDGVSGRLVQPEDPYALAEVIREFLHTSPAEMQEGIKRVAASMTWESLSQHILDCINSTSEK